MATQKSVVDQDTLYRAIKSLFPNEYNTVNSRKKSFLKYPSGVYFEIDVWIPKLNLCFEFQDTYHYVTTWYSNHNLPHIQQRDNFKRETTQKLGITLIIVPCWWDGSAISLQDTICFQRPDLHLNYQNNTINLNPPIGYFDVPEIPDVGELMIAAFPHDSSFIFSIPERTWWMGEKYDGIRCCWNPNRKRLYSRSGYEISLYAPLDHTLPSIFMDSEAWYGRGTFYQAQRIVTNYRNSVNNESQINENSFHWDTFRLNVFDVPSPDLKNEPFEKRYATLLSCNSVTVILAPRVLSNQSTLEWFSQQITDNSGEGIILRKSNSVYENGRSRYLVKIKGIFEDREAIVIEKDSSSVILNMPDGHIFSVPNKNIHVPRITTGDVVTFSYRKGEEFVNPIIHRVRMDISWPEVLQNSKQMYRTNELIYTKRRWTDSTMRLFMEKVSKKNGLNPLYPATWYTLTPSDIYKFQGGRSIIGSFQGGYINALKKLFPDIGLNFADLAAHHGFLNLNEVANRRLFFENFAKMKGFNAKNPLGWYKQSKNQFLAYKGARTMLTKYYRGNLPKALLDIFPDIGFNRPLLYALFDFVPKNKQILQQHNYQRL